MLRQRYACSGGLTIDGGEAEALERILSGCESTDLEPVVCTAPSPSGSVPASAAPSGDDALALYDDNRNGRIICKEARRHGIDPVPRSHPPYRLMQDADTIVSFVSDRDVADCGLFICFSRSTGCPSPRCLES